MAIREPLQIGVVGACARGRSLVRGLSARAEVARVAAVCDTDAESLPQVRAETGAEHAFTDFDDLLACPGLDAVVVATPMPLHASQSIAALQAGLHVLSEVTAAVDIDRCRQLVAAVEVADGLYMMAENANYMVPNLVVTALVDAGLFGTPYFADGEYLHELKARNEQTPWRRRWQTGVDGITYGTHSLGPMLRWLPGRVTEVCCAGSGHHYHDPRGDDYHQDTHVMLGRVEPDGLVKVRVDMISDRPSVTTTYQLQGTHGCYESSRARGEPHRVWLRDRAEDERSWLDLDDLVDEFFPARWRDTLDSSAGHGGSDARVLAAFVDAVRGDAPLEIDVHVAMDQTLPGLISQQSMRQDGIWLPVPNSRDWVEAA
jgi:predicted dehydrogenase